MKQNLNERKRMQKLAGLLNENEEPLSDSNLDDIEDIKSANEKLIDLVKNMSPKKFRELIIKVEGEDGVDLWVSNSINSINNKHDRIEMIDLGLEEDDAQRYIDALNSLNENHSENKELKDYYDFLLDLGGGDLAGEYEDMLEKFEQYNSFKEFVEEDIEILASDDEEQAQEIRNWFKKYLKK